MEQQPVRPSPLGKDRFITGIGSLWAKEDFLLKVQIAESGVTTALTAKEELDALLGSLNIKGIWERALKCQLDKFYDNIRSKDVQQKMLHQDVEMRRSSRLHAAQQKEDM